VINKRLLQPTNESSKQGGALKYKAKNLGVLYIHQKKRRGWFKNKTL
jgi:hypothetical protein